MSLIIVDSKKVNMDTAEKLGGYWYGTSAGDFDYISETIYKTAKGNYLFSGDGGAGTRYGRKVAMNTTAGGSATYFIGRVHAFQHLQEWGADVNMLLREFGDLIEEA